MKMVIDKEAAIWAVKCASVLLIISAISLTVMTMIGMDEGEIYLINVMILWVASIIIVAITIEKNTGGIKK